MPRLDGIAMHEDFAVTQEVVSHHAGSDRGDDDPVVADDAAARGFGESDRFPARAPGKKRCYFLQTSPTLSPNQRVLTTFCCV